MASLTQNLAGTAQDNTWSYTRNQVQDIKAASWTNDSYQWTGYTNGTRSYTANGLNQYATAAGSTLSYDANGNLGGDGVWTYAYNLDNQLTAANKTGSANSLAYDGAGRLSQTTLAGVVTNLSYDGSDLVAEYNSTGALMRRYVHGPGIDEPLVAYNGSGTGAKFWLYGDHQGSIVATAMSDGNIAGRISYDPYGANDGDGTLFRFRYTGQQLIGPLNLYYYKARIYSPAIGRFLQTDPIGYGDGLNWYAYVGNNPFNRRDPSGLAMTRLGNIASEFQTTARETMQVPGVGVSMAPAVVVGDGVVAVLAGGLKTYNAVSDYVSNAPGTWKNVNESMSAQSAAYQARVTGSNPGTAYTVNGVKFDGYQNGVLLDAKANYAQFVNKDTGQFQSWFSGQKGLVDQAVRQLGAAEGTPIQWNFAEESAANATRTLLNTEGISGIKIVHVP